MTMKLGKLVMAVCAVSVLAACGHYGDAYHYRDRYYEESPPNYEEPRCDRVYDTRNCERYYEGKPKTY